MRVLEIGVLWDSVWGRDEAAAYAAAVRRGRDAADRVLPLLGIRDVQLRCSTNFSTTSVRSTSSAASFTPSFAVSPASYSKSSALAVFIRLRRLHG